MEATPNPTAEQIAYEAIHEVEVPLHGGDRVIAQNVIDALRAHDILSEPSAPSEKCTCPSGDGSLRWPCPSHPPAPQELNAWRCGKCGRATLRGEDDGQIPEHHRTCPKRAPQEPISVCDDDGCLHYDHSPAPSPDREKLIAEYVNPRMTGRNNSDGHLMAQAFRAGWDAALAAQPVLDREKVRQTVMNALPYTVEVSGPDSPAMYAHRTNRGAWQESGPIADAICEAAKRGELS